MKPELYVLSGSTYLRSSVIDEYMSSIWTERYIEPGEMELNLPATDDNYALLRKGTLLSHSESRQPMRVDTVEVQGRVLKATGNTLLQFFNERHIDDFTVTDTPGAILGEIITRMQSLASDEGIDIPNLVLGVIDTPDTEVTEKIEGGQAGDALQKVAKKYGIGMGVYRVRKSSGAGYELHFSTYVGQNHTVAVRFDPKMDNFSNVRDLVSDRDYKSVAITRPPSQAKTHLSVDPPPVTVYNDPADEDLPVWEVQVLDVDCEDISDDDIGPGTEAEKLVKLHDLMLQKAREALNDKKRTDIVDGEVISGESQYRYYEADDADSYVSYRMGDLISVVGNFGAKRQSYISEYIRSIDDTGQRAYPTLAQNLGPTGEGGISFDGKKTHTFIVGPAFGVNIAEGTVVPPYSSHKGSIIAYRYWFQGGGEATVKVYAGPTLDLLTTVTVTGTRALAKQDPPHKMQHGDPIYIEISEVIEPCAGLMFSVIYDK